MTTSALTATLPRASASPRRGRGRAPRTQAERHLLGGVPMPWMSKWAGGFVYLAEPAARA